MLPFDFVYIVGERLEFLLIRIARASRLTLPHSALLGEWFVWTRAVRGHPKLARRRTTRRTQCWAARTVRPAGRLSVRVRTAAGGEDGELERRERVSENRRVTFGAKPPSPYAARSSTRAQRPADCGSMI